MTRFLLEVKTSTVTLPHTHQHLSLSNRLSLLTKLCPKDIENKLAFWRNWGSQDKWGMKELCTQSRVGSITTCSWSSQFSSPIACHLQWNRLKSLTIWSQMEIIQMPNNVYANISQIVFSPNFSSNYTFQILFWNMKILYNIQMFTVNIAACLFFGSLELYCLC